MWTLTHDSDNFHYEIYARLESEQQILSIPGLDEQMGATWEDQAPHKRYSIRLSRKKWPFNVSVSHQLVIRNVARFSTAEVLRYFDCCQVEAADLVAEADDENQVRGGSGNAGGKQNNNIGVQFVNYFVRWPIAMRQNQLIQLLKSRSLKYLLMSESDLIATNLIQCISKCLHFISNEIVRVQMFVKQIFFFTLKLNN